MLQRGVSLGVLRSGFDGHGAQFAGLLLKPGEQLVDAIHFSAGRGFVPLGLLYFCPAGIAGWRGVVISGRRSALQEGSRNQRHNDRG
ncbi:hypothetical protein E1809_03935 [Arthrobacter terricola]|uniref:Uncharacterized protein n=1 Tax=Arthrobacter terricola TaxID=2547396 RepID=A0A4R5KYI9_9MICC|nr:hypothetical protein E1809_03935 [Arthrobacter terricola]